MFGEELGGRAKPKTEGSVEEDLSLPGNSKKVIVLMMDWDNPISVLEVHFC